MIGRNDGADGATDGDGSDGTTAAADGGGFVADDAPAVAGFVARTNGVGAIVGWGSTRRDAARSVPARIPSGIVGIRPATRAAIDALDRDGADARVGPTADGPRGRIVDAVPPSDPGDGSGSDDPAADPGDGFPGSPGDLADDDRFGAIVRAGDVEPGATIASLTTGRTYRVRGDVPDRLARPGARFAGMGGCVWVERVDDPERDGHFVPGAPVVRVRGAGTDATADADV